MWSMPSCHRRKVCTGPPTSLLAGTTDRFTPDLCCFCPVIQYQIKKVKTCAAIRSMPSCHRRKIYTGPHTTSLSGTANRFTPGLGRCFPVIQTYKRMGKLDLLSCQGPIAIGVRYVPAHTTSLSGTANRGLTNLCCCIPDIHVQQKISATRCCYQA